MNGYKLVEHDDKIAIVDIQTGEEIVAVTSKSAYGPALRNAYELGLSGLPIISVYSPLQSAQESQLLSWLWKLGYNITYMVVGAEDYHHYTLMLDGHKMAPTLKDLEHYLHYTRVAGDDGQAYIQYDPNNPPPAPFPPGYEEMRGKK